MNSFSTFGGMMFGKGGKTNVNSFSYINGFAKILTVDFSGSSVTDLSNASASSYAKTACGINIDNNNTTFARIKYGTNYLNTSDFNTGSGSFTFHLKHAARYNTLPPFNFQYPNVLTTSSSSPSIGSIFTISFYSLLDKGTIVPYKISGCTSTHLSGASLSGTFTAPYQSIIYTVANNYGNSVSFNVSGGAVLNILLTAPFDTTSCVTWLDATASVGILGDGTAITTANISDQSPNKRNINRVTTTVTFNGNGLKSGYPGYITTNGGIHFNLPAYTFLRASDDIGALTYFAVYSLNMAGNNGMILSRSVGNWPYFMDGYGTYRIFYKALTPFTTQTHTGTFNFNTGIIPTLYSSKITNSASNLIVDERYRNASGIGRNTLGLEHASQDVATTIGIGVRDDNYGSTGVFSEVIVFNTALSLDEHYKIEGYLAWKWGLVANLQIGHPYKNRSILSTPPYPIIWYKFDETFGATVTNYGDSGATCQGAITNTSYLSYSLTNKKYGTSSLYSNSTASAGNSYLVVPIQYISSEYYPVGITISFWVMFQSLPTADTIIMGNTPDTALVSGFVCFLRSNSTGFQCYNDTLPITSPVSINLWYHYVQTYNPTTTIKKTYVNGSLLGTQTLTITPPPTNNVYLINQGNTSYSSLNGWLDDFRVYPGELSLAQIAAIYST